MRLVNPDATATDAILVAAGLHFAVAAEHGAEAGLRHACHAIVGAVAFIESARGRERAQAVLAAALAAVEAGRL